MKKKSLIIVGGNRHLDDGPLVSVLNASKKNKIKVFLVTDKLHLNKPCKNFKTFKELLKKNKVDYLEVNNLKKTLFFKNYLKKYPNTILLTTFCFFKINSKILNLFPNRIFNYHLGKIPEQVGASSSFWQMMSGQVESAISFHKTSKDLDAGDVLYEKKFKLKKGYSTNEFYKSVRKYEKIALDHFLRSVFKNKRFRIIKKNNNNKIYMPKLDTKIHGFINWSWNAKDIATFAKVFDHPFIGASTFMKEKRVYLRNVSYHKSKINFHPFQSGIIFNKDKNKIYIACLNGFIKASLFDIKKKINLSKVILGTKLYTDQIYLDRANKTRSIHTGIKIKFKI